jgi:hypothetical protein
MGEPAEGNDWNVLNETVKRLHIVLYPLQTRRKEQLLNF